MKVAINILPLKSKHKDRGIGFYTSNLIANLRTDSEIELQEFTHLSEVKYADIIHYPWFDLFHHTLPIRKKFKTVVTIHDVIPLIFPEQHPVGFRGRLNFTLQKLALRDCKHIITDSIVSKNDISKYLSIDKEKISVVYLAANENFRIKKKADLLYISRKYKLPERFLLYVGDANWVKNLPLLVQAFNDLIQTEGFEDIKLVLVGAVFLKKIENINHPELNSLKRVNGFIKDKNLETVILRPGDLDLEELISFYNLATVYIQPSSYEGFGLPVIEAFNCGIPVVSSSKGSLMEIGGNAAIYFDPIDLNQLVSILKEVLQNRPLRDKLSRLGLQQAEKFSWRKVITETKKVYIETFKNE